MPTLRSRDRYIVVLFAAIWLSALGMRVVSFDRPAPEIPYVTRPDSGPPVVVDLIFPATTPADQFVLGDRVLAVGDLDVRHFGQLDLQMALVDATWRHRVRPPITVERDGRRVTRTAASHHPRLPAYYTGVVVSLVWGIAAILILLRAPPTVRARVLFSALAFHALMYISYFDAPGGVYAYSLGLSFLTVLVAQPLLAYAFLSFPEETDALHGWNRVWPWAFVAVGLAAFSGATGIPWAPTTARSAVTPLAVAYILTLLVILTRNYRRSGPVGRRQIKWILYAVYLGALLAFVAYGVSGGVPSSAGTRLAASLIMVASISFPIMVLVAVLRFDLLDIDRLLGATMAYNLVGIIVVAAGFVVVPPLTEMLSSLLSLDPTVGRTVMAMGLAGVVIVTERRVRPYVDRLFFKERFALEQAMEEFPNALAVARGPDDLWQLTGDQLVQHVRPATCVIYAWAEETFVPVYSDGETAPPALPSTADLVGRLDGLDGATAVDLRALRRSSALDHAILTGLEAKLVIPVHRRTTLEAFIILGEKRSGDIYTKTDRTLLTALARSLSLHLLRFDDAELLARTRAIQEQMQRYVPGALAEVIATGDTLETGEKEVSVLFVDIRGYTAYAHGRGASDTFSTVNRYTETVSTIVTECGGVVVEFNGDGMMAVFGAPKPLPDKEAAAVTAAHRLVEEVPRIAGDVETGDRLAVGVGIATGEAYVGNIEAVDRTIWSAIGSTTNLAARLQALTRDLDAAILIEGVTHERGGAAVAAFEPRSGVTIRGRADIETVYALPSRA